MKIVSLLTHLFFPHESNNQKAKILHPSSLLVISIILLVFQVLLSLSSRSGVKILGYASNIPVEEVVRLTNEKRAESGLSSLEYNPTLSAAAKAKGEDMLAKDYWAHVSPDGIEPWKFFTDVGYAYRYAGENLARDFSNASSAVEAWMASPTHKDNILSSKYKEIGIAVVEGDMNGVDTTIIVQLFGTKISQVPEIQPVAENTSVQATPAAVAQVAEVPVVTSIPSPTAEPSTYLTGLTQGEEEEVPTSVLVSPFISTKSISLVVVGFLMVVFVVDAAMVSKRRIARVSGRSFAHISFLGMILAIILILRSGQIL